VSEVTINQTKSNEIDINSFVIFACIVVVVVLAHGDPVPPRVCLSVCPCGPVVPGPGGAAQTALRPHGGLVVPGSRDLRDDLQPGTVGGAAFACVIACCDVSDHV